MLRVQPAFLRRLDSEDLVSPERSDGRQRRYTRSEIDQIQRVSELAGEGLTLAGIRRLLALEAEVAQLKREASQLWGGQAGSVSTQSGICPPGCAEVLTLGLIGQLLPTRFLVFWVVPTPAFKGEG